MNRRAHLDDDLTMADWQRVRSLQRGDPFGGVADAAPTDDLGMSQWQLARDRQVRGLTAP